MIDEPTRFPTCPMCGVDYDLEIKKPFAHAVTCLLCGESFDVPGNPDATLPEFTRPFWSDQFRKYRDDDRSPAGLDPAMLMIVGSLLLLILLCAGMALLTTQPGARYSSLPKSVSRTVSRHPGIYSLRLPLRGHERA